jgi:hypothetical protein
VKDKTVAVGRKHKRNIQGGRVIERLLHAIADAVRVVFCLDDGNRNVRLVIKDVIRPLGLAAGDEFTSNDDAAFGEGHFLANLHHPVPARALDGGAYELGADVALAEVFFVHTFVVVARQSEAADPSTQRVLFAVQQQSAFRQT